MNISSAGYSCTGGYEINEDPYMYSTEKGIFIVADGLGGHSGGKRTSLTAIEYFKEHFSGNYTNECISHLPEGANKEVMGKGTAARLPLPPPHLSQLFLIKGKGKHCKTAQTNETGTGA